MAQGPDSVTNHEGETQYLTNEIVLAMMVTVIVDVRPTEGTRTRKSVIPIGIKRTNRSLWFD